MCSLFFNQYQGLYSLNCETSDPRFLRNLKGARFIFYIYIYLNISNRFEIWHVAQK